MEEIKKKRQRSENWSEEEKEILRELISKSRDILENKSTKTITNMIKNKEWSKIKYKLNELTGRNRGEAEIKLAWKRMKLLAKANLSLIGREQNKTGGGPKPPSPSPEDLQIMAIAPHDFIIDVNDYDSDAVIQMPDAPCSSSSKAPTFEDEEQPLVVIIQEDSNDDTVRQGSSDNITKENTKPKEKEKTIPKKNRTDQQRNAIVESNIAFKRRQLEMLEEEHHLNVEIANLQIKKLNLEIKLLQKKANEE